MLGWHHSSSTEAQRKLRRFRETRGVGKDIRRTAGNPKRYLEYVAQCCWDKGHIPTVGKPHGSLARYARKGSGHKGRTMLMFASNSYTSRHTTRSERQGTRACLFNGNITGIASKYITEECCSETNRRSFTLFLSVVLLFAQPYTADISTKSLHANKVQHDQQTIDLDEFTKVPKRLSECFSEKK